MNAHDFLEAFVPLLVAIDPLGLLPIFLSVTRHLDAPQRRRASLQAVGSAAVITLSFMFFGNEIFHFIGIETADFMVGGGIILLMLALIDLLIPGKPAVDEDHVVGLVPLAMPLIAGPATLTTTIVLAGHHPYPLVALALAANLLIVLIVLFSAERIARRVGVSMLRAMSQLVMVLLVAVAVHFIHIGIVEMIRAAKAE
jgi:multiple antibiotic resistance protein